jgi:DNA-binding CsgD family transcriptional regulator
VLCDLVGRQHLESAEQMHLVTVDRTGASLQARLAHPLFGELRRANAGEMYLSKVRGGLAQRIGQQTDADPQMTVRRALLTLESNLVPDPELYLAAARHTMTLLDLDLAERLATAAAAAGSTEAVKTLAVNRFLAGAGERAEELLRDLAGNDDAERGTSDEEESPKGDVAEGRHRWVCLRAANLVWMLGRPAEAAEILAVLAHGGETDAQRAVRYAVEACVDVFFARCTEAEEKARAALASDDLSDLDAMLASVALLMACGALGHADDIGQVALAALDRASTSYEASHMRFWFGGVYARACRLTGRIEACRTAAARLSALAEDMPGLAYANLVFLTGVAELMRGELPGAVRMLHEALAGAENHGVTTGLGPACTFALAEAHAKLGESQEATAMLAQARQRVKPEALFMQTGLALATGWVQAANGSLAEATATVLEEAKVARHRGQPTHELACLQAAAQWGVEDVLPHVAARARELATELSLPVADAVARHAESLLARDGEGLLEASEAYRAFGDRATAADAAAQAAVAFTGAQQRNRGLFAGSVAKQLAVECGGLCTPATRSPASPTPLTGVQREVAEMVAAGLTNKDIADKRVCSVRTVEGHILRACQRVGASSRHDLARIMRLGWQG